MSDADKKPDAPAAAKPKKGSPMGIVVSAILAGAAAFGGARFAQPHTAHAAESLPEAKPPGPTIQLEPFLVTITDSSKKTHAMKVSLAVEFVETVKEELLKSYVPRTRDLCLSYLRVATFEQMAEGDETKVRAEILAKLKEGGVVFAERILITDFVVQ